MKNKKFLMYILIAAVIFVFFGFWFMFSSSSNKSILKENMTIMPSANKISKEITKDLVVEQEFICNIDTISRLGVVFSYIYDSSNSEITLELLKGNETLAKNVISAKDISDQHRTFLIPNSVITNVKNKQLKLKISSNDDSGFALMIDENSNATYKFGDSSLKGRICFVIEQ